jgi:hypothetical protein
MENRRVCVCCETVQRYRSGCGSAMALLRLSRVAALDMYSAGSIHTHSQAAVEMSLQGESCRSLTWVVYHYFNILDSMPLLQYSGGPFLNFHAWWRPLGYFLIQKEQQDELPHPIISSWATQWSTVCRGPRDGAMHSAQPSLTREGHSLQHSSFEHRWII